jgi:hypothetical protein
MKAPVRADGGGDNLNAERAEVVLRVKKAVYDEEGELSSIRAAPRSVAEAIAVVPLVIPA